MVSNGLTRRKVLNPLHHGHRPPLPRRQKYHKHYRYTTPILPAANTRSHPSADGDIEHIVSLLLNVFSSGLFTIPPAPSTHFLTFPTTPDIAMESLTGRDQSVERLMYTLIVKHAVRNGECLVARSAHCSSDIYGVAAWLAPGVEWDFQ